MYTLFDLEAAPPAPDPTLSDSNGKAVSLSDYWRDAELTAFTLTRHFGCIFCREQVRDLMKHAGALQQVGVQVIVIGPAEAKDAAWFQQRFAVPFPVLADTTGDVYASFGLADGAGGQLFSPKIVARAAGAVLRGSPPDRPRGRSKQLPGMVLIDRGGRVRMRQVASDASDHLDAGELLRIVEELRALDRQALASR